MNEKKSLGLSGEYKRFNKLIKPLRKLCKDTFQAIDTVIEAEHLTCEQVSSISASSTEVSELHKCLHHPSAIVIAGQDNYGKVAVLTKLLGTRLLPFTGFQHTCNTANIEGIHVTQNSGNSTINPNLTTAALVSAQSTSYISQPYQSSIVPLGVEKYEKPWRGIRITHSISQITYSVVRPDRVSPCQCEGKNDVLEHGATVKTNEAVHPNECEKSFPFHVSLNLSQSACVIEQPLSGATHENEDVINTAGDYQLAHPVTEDVSFDFEQLNKDGHPSGFNEITVTQLENLLEKKLHTYVEQQNISSDKSSNSLEAAVTEVPLSEIELDSRHLQDPILRDALLDVGLNHCLLREHVQIIVTPSINRYKDLHITPKNSLIGEQKSCTVDDVRSTASEVPCRSAFVEINQIGSSDTDTNSDFMAEMSPQQDASSKAIECQLAQTLPPAPLELLQFPKQYSNFLDTSAATQSSTGLYGTPLSTSDVNREAQFSSVPVSPASSLDSFQSFKSVHSASPVQDNDPYQLSAIPRRIFKLVRSKSYSSAQSLHSQSGLVLSNVSRSIFMDDSRRLDSSAEPGTARKPQDKARTRSLSLDFSENSVKYPESNKESSGTLIASLSVMTPYGDSHVLPEEASDDNCFKFDENNEVNSSCGLDENEEDKGFMGTLLPNVTAVILYAITKDYFTEQNVTELKEIRSHTPACPVMFIHVPPLLNVLRGVSADEQQLLLAEYGIMPRPMQGCDPEYPSEALDAGLAVDADVHAVPQEEIEDSEQRERNPSLGANARAGIYVSESSVFQDNVGNKKQSLVTVPVKENRVYMFDFPDGQEATLGAVGFERNFQATTEDQGGATYTPNREDEQGDPMVFYMDNTPKKDNKLHEEIKVLYNKSKSVKFTLEGINSEKRLLGRSQSSKGTEAKTKRDKGLIIAGNCSDEYTEEDAKKIKVKTADLFRSSQRQIYRGSEKTTIVCHDSDAAKFQHTSRHSADGVSLFIESGMNESINKVNDSNDFSKIPNAIIHYLRDELGFFKRDQSGDLNHVRHSHLHHEDLDLVEHSRNPFVNAYNRVNGGLSDTDYFNSDEGATTSDEASDSSSAGIKTGKKSKLRKRGEKNDLHQCPKLCVECAVLDSFTEFDHVQNWVKLFLRGHISYTAQLLSKVQSRCLSSFVVFAFEFSRRLQITPRRLAYAKQQEEELCHALLAAARHREEHIRGIIVNTLQRDREELLEMAEMAGHGSPASYSEASVQECVLRELNRRVGSQLVSDVAALRENCLGTLRRCLAQLELDCSSGGEQPGVTHALKKLVNAAYQVEARPTSSWGLLRGVWERVKELLSGGSGGDAGGRGSPGSRPWRRQVAADMIDGLSERRLAKTISAQVCGEIKSAHALFLSHLSLLEQQLDWRMANTEHRQRQLKAVHAPRLARLALHTDALNNRVQWGLPSLCGELGRGHFGVVYSCPGWGRYSPCAVKTLLPRDATQWKDIALQYHYTRLMGSHPRIVSIHACLIDKHFGEASRALSLAEGGGFRDGGGAKGVWGGVKSGGGGGLASNQCVLLIMDVHKCDLDAAIRGGLQWQQRFRIAIDVVQGIRFLHSQGLIHRDIKPKNVMIDDVGRAKVTDLDFCKPEAMMTGSVVGTPIHMAPELFSGSYDNSVDVYAFGVLFWYLCSGKTNMPKNYCLQKSKEDLKYAVFKGVRPECLPSFTPACWTLMEDCWAPEPRERALLGTVEDRLRVMLNTCRAEMRAQGNSEYFNAETGTGTSDNDSYSSPSEDSALEESQG